MMAQDIAARPVSYAITVIEPENPDVCPGDALRYPLTVDVVEIPALLSVAETWCRAGIDGVCSTSLTRSYQLPLLEYRHIETVAVRIVPQSSFFVPGQIYEFWHAAANSDTTGYIVRPVRIRTDCGEGASGSN